MHNNIRPDAAPLVKMFLETLNTEVLIDQSSCVLHIEIPKITSSVEPQKQKTVPTQYSYVVRKQEKVVANSHFQIILR